MSSKMGPAPQPKGWGKDVKAARRRAGRKRGSKK